MPFDPNFSTVSEAIKCAGEKITKINEFIDVSRLIKKCLELCYKKAKAGYTATKFVKISQYFFSIWYKSFQLFIF